VHCTYLFVTALSTVVLCHQVSKKYVSKEIGQEIHGKAKPFLNWLAEAEEESSEEEEKDEEDVDVSTVAQEYSRSTMGQFRIQKG